MFLLIGHVSSSFTIIACVNASDSFEKFFSERSIPSKIKLTSVKSSIDTDLI